MSAALDNRQVVQKALIVLVGFAASGVLGFLRTAVLARQFGTGAAHDSFVAAQQIPELVFVLVAGGALGSSFIPIYAKYREQDPQQAWQLASSVMTLAALAAAALGLIVALFAPQLVSTVLSPGRPAEQQQLTIAMVRLMMLTPFIFSISGLVMGILQSHAAFWLPAIAISMNHIGIIIGALIIAPALPAHADVGQVGDLNILGLAYGAILSAILHLLVQLPGLIRIRARLRPLLSLQVPGVITVLQLMGPRILGLAVVQVNMVVNISLASNMVEGSVTALKVAFTMMFFALGMIGQSVGSAVFPTLAALWAERDHDGFKDRLSMAMRNVLFLSFPATALLIILGEPIFGLFESGQWTRESSQAAAWALAFYATGIAGFTLLEVLSRAFYALEDTKTPVIIGSIAMISNIALNLIFDSVNRRSRESGTGSLCWIGLSQCAHNSCRVAFPVVADAPPHFRSWHIDGHSRSRHPAQRRRQLDRYADHGSLPVAIAGACASRRLGAGSDRLSSWRMRFPGCQLSL